MLINPNIVEHRHLVCGDILGDPRETVYKIVDSFSSSDQRREQPASGPVDTNLYQWDLRTRKSFQYF